MEKFRTSDGLELAYVVDDYTDPWRKPDTLVMVHAAMGSSRRFYAWVPHLARDFRVVRMDLRGHGESSPIGTAPLSFERLGLDVVELVDHIGADRAHLAGSSAGAYIAQGVAIKHPHRVASLACFAATPGMKLAKQDYGGWVKKIGAGGISAFLRETISDRMDLNSVAPGFVDWFIAEAARTNIESLARFVPVMASVDQTPQLANIKCPTLVVVPGNDPIHPVEEYRLLERLLPRCEFIVYEGLPHNITDTVPDRCARELNRFLKALR